MDINTHIRQLRRESRILPEIEKILSPPVHSESTSAPEIEIRITPDPESERTFLPVVEKRSAPKIEVTSASGTIPIEDALAFQLGPTNFSGSIGQPAEVFICYRRDDTEDATARIWDVLSEEFGSMKVFRDVDSIPPGVDFRIHIRNILANCRVVLVIIGRDWINQTDQDGKRRLDDSDDHVRIELEAALARNNLPVVPVLVRRAEFPDKKLLPDSIKSLALRSGMTIRSDQHFRDDVEKLVRYLNEDLGVKSARSES